MTRIYLYLVVIILVVEVMGHRKMIFSPIKYGANMSGFYEFALYVVFAVVIAETAMFLFSKFKKR